MRWTQFADSQKPIAKEGDVVSECYIDLRCCDPPCLVKFVVADQGYGRGGTPIFTGVFEPVARVALYPTDEGGLGTYFSAA